MWLTCEQAAHWTQAARCCRLPFDVRLARLFTRSANHVLRLLPKQISVQCREHPPTSSSHLKLNVCMLYMVVCKAQLTGASRSSQTFSLTLLFPCSLRLACALPYGPGVRSGDRSMVCVIVRVFKTVAAYHSS